MAYDSLHRRGYRSAMHRASLNEAAAAGLLRVAGWPQPGAGARRHSRHCSVDVPEAVLPQRLAASLGYMSYLLAAASLLVAAAVAVAGSPGGMQIICRGTRPLASLACGVRKEA